MEQFAYSSVADLAKRIRKKELSPVELMESTIKDIEKRNQDTNAFVHSDFSRARKEANRAEKKVMNGEELELLHGIPTAVKDLFDTKQGWPTTLGGIPALENNVGGNDGVYAERTEKAGAIVVGNTNSPIMGFRGTCDNPLFGPTKNPFDRTKNSGGSSGGSAAAVADGLIPIAEGTDGGGSVRIPSSWSGTFGYQASFGRVPSVTRPNAYGGLNPFIYEGTITRNVEDAAIGMTAMTGFDVRDPLSIGGKVDYLGAMGKPMDGWKIAFSPDWDVYAVDGDVKKVVQDAVALFEDAGAHVEEVSFGIGRDQMELSDLWCRMIMGLSVPAFEGMKHQGLDLLKDYRGDFPDEFVHWFEKAKNMNLLDIQDDQAIRTEVFDAVQNVFNDYDLIVTPTTACLPVENATNGETKGPTEINGMKVDPLIGWCLTFITNFTGHPAASIPAGFVNNLPVGMQIIGKRLADEDVFTASSAFEKLKPWHGMYEKLRSRI